MNPPGGRPPSRFVRGRARGGGAYRPYFFFRRNGRVIPAGGNRHETTPGENTAPRGGTSVRSRGWNRSRSDGIAGRKRAPNATVDCSFLRPEHYAAPENGLQVHSLLVDNPRACPGWRLYFLREEYVAESELALRIVAVEAHYQRNPKLYVVEQIRKNGFFKMTAEGITEDEQLQAVWPTLTMDLRLQPLRTLSTLALAMHTVLVNDSLDAADEASRSEIPVATSKDLYVPCTVHTRKIYARLENFAPVEMVNSISHERVDSLFAVRGIVSSVGEPTYNLAWHAFRCTRCHTVQAMRQRGNYTPRPYNCLQPKCNAKDNFLALRSSPYTRLSVRQIIRLEESTLSLLTDYDNTLPGELDIELRHDLVDEVHIGQEIVVTGVLKLRELCAEPGTSTKAAAAFTAGEELKAYLRAISVQQASQVPREFSKIDIKAIEVISSEPNIFKLLVQSLAPEVHGHELAKAGCLLSLIGGVDAGAINVLLVGDPGVGKSKIINNCAQITERGSHISGKRGVQSTNQLGITFSGRNKRVMSAGALVSANSPGHCVVDGVDKLASKQSLLMQCMQAGQLNVPLPSIFASLDAQPSIIGCANPQRGQYDQARYLLQNIRMPAALLKEFHLVYVLLDKPSASRDISLTEHVRALHSGSKKRARIAARYAIKSKENESVCEEASIAPTELNEDSILMQDYDLDKRLVLNMLEKTEFDLLPHLLIKKFIAFARQNVKPLLSDDAAKDIMRHFLELRRLSEAEHEHSQIGLGQLLGLISLSQARARMDLSSVVTPLHVRDVIAVLTESIAQTRLGGDQSAAPRSSGKGSQLQRFVQMMQLRSKALGRRIFEFEELKEIGTRAGILTGITKLVELANLGGYLLKKGVNMYEVVPD